MKSLISLVCLSLIIIACDPEINYVARVKFQKLAVSEIYDEEKVENVLFDAQENNLDSLHKKSRQLFLSGIDAFKNKHQVDEAIHRFKLSLLYLPDSKTYYELGNAIMEASRMPEDFDEAKKAYQMALRLDFRPKGMVYYKMAAANYMKEPGSRDNYFVIQNLTQAFAEGFTDTVALRKDKFLASFVKSDNYVEFQHGLRTLLVKNNPDELFQAFVSSFPKMTDEKLAIPVTEITQSDHRRSIGYEFAAFIPEMENTSFGRDVSHDFIYVANVRETPFYYALVYATVSYFGENMQPVHIKLVTYNHEGGIIASKLLAGQFSAEKIKTGFIDKDKVTITEYKRTWEKPFTEVSPDENKIIKHDEIAKAVFRINDDGTFRNESVPVEFNDSLMLTKQ